MPGGFTGGQHIRLSSGLQAQTRLGIPKLFTQSCITGDSLWVALGCGVKWKVGGVWGKLEGGWGVGCGVNWKVRGGVVGCLTRKTLKRHYAGPNPARGTAHCGTPPPPPSAPQSTQPLCLPLGICIQNIPRAGRISWWQASFWLGLEQVSRPPLLAMRGDEWRGL